MRLLSQEVLHARMVTLGHELQETQQPNTLDDRHGLVLVGLRHLVLAGALLRLLLALRLLLFTSRVRRHGLINRQELLLFFGLLLC